MHMESSSGCSTPGCDYVVRPRLIAAHGQEVHRIRQNPAVAENTITLLDEAGSILSTQQAPLSRSVTVTLPDVEGTYTIQAETDLGPYQGPVGGALSVTVADPSSYDLSLGGAIGSLPRIQ